VAAVRSAHQHDTGITDHEPLQPAVENHQSRTSTLLDTSLLREHAQELGAEKADHIVGLFNSTVPTLLAKARQELHAGNTKGVVQAAHRIKSSALTIGLQAIGRLAEALEDQAAKGNAGDSENLIGQLEHSLVTATAALGAVLDEMHRQDAAATPSVPVDSNGMESGHK
jgi:HPt (histidine-containing phosphotransfer) domain-containing protein